MRSAPQSSGHQDSTHLNRYTPTYKSTAFAHSEYQPPLSAPDSAADRTLRSTGTSIEDYGRRDVAPRKEELFSNSPLAKKAAQERYERKVYGEEL